MIFSLDSNILFYAMDRDSSDKNRISRDLLGRALRLDLVLAGQAVAELLTVVRRKRPALFLEAAAEVARWAALVPVAPTTWSDVARAAAFAERHRLQLWDSVIWQVARRAGATVLLSEDFQDGLSIDGLTVVNPFNTANSGRIEALLVAGT